MSVSPNIGSIHFDYDASKLCKNMAAMEKKVGTAVMMYMATQASETEAYMKLNRPWTDRTGMAKTMLNTKVSQPNENTIRLTLAHGVDYGIWLELAHGKNYAIIGPTLNVKAPEIIEGLQGLISKITL